MPQCPAFEPAPVLVDVLQPALEALLLLIRGKGLLRQAAVVHHQAEGVVRVLLELGERQLEKGQQRPQLLAEPVWVLAVDCAPSGAFGRVRGALGREVACGFDSCVATHARGS